MSPIRCIFAPLGLRRSPSRDKLFLYDSDLVCNSTQKAVFINNTINHLSYQAITLMQNFHIFFRNVIIFFSAVLCFSNAFAQQIYGTVRDGAGMPIVNARVTLFSEDTTFFSETRSNTSGYFTYYIPVPTGKYNIGVTSAGKEYKQVTVIVDKTNFTSFDFQLANDTKKGSWEVLNKAGEKLGGTNSATLLPDGRILFCHDTQDPILFDPVKNTIRKAANSQSIQGCAAVGLLQDGRVIFAGGAATEVYGPGTRQVKTYNPAKDEWKVETSINDYRWYPTMIQFPDGDLLAIGGGGLGNPIRVKTCEIMDHKTMIWSYTDTVTIGNEVSPIALLKTGDVLMTHRPPQLFNTVTKKWKLAADFVQGPRNPDGQHPDHEIILLPNGKVVAIGYDSRYYPTKPADNVEIYDPVLNSWKLGANMLPVRYWCKSTLLPDKKILVTGGFKVTPSDTSYVNEWGAMRLTDIYDPTNDSWQRMSGLNFAREYHSTPLLVPDGRVVVTGGEGKPGEEPKDTSVIEAFSPPYLFKGIRPEMKDLTQTDFPRGTEIVFRIAKTSAPTSIILKGTEAVTHFMNTGIARFLELPFTQNGDTIHAKLPSDNVELPIGFYIVFAMTDDIPSVGKIVHISPEKTNGLPSQNNSENSMLRLTNFPNPFHGNTSLRFFLPEPGKAEITLYSVLGIKLREYHLGENSAGWNTISLDESHLPAGVYSLKLRAGNAIVNTKLSIY